MKYISEPFIEKTIFFFFLLISFEISVDLRRRRWQRRKWLDDITDSMNVNLSQLQEVVKDREAWHASFYGVAKSWTWLNWIALTWAMCLFFCWCNIISTILVLNMNLHFFHLFLLVGGYLLYNIEVVFVIHWHESARDLHVFPMPIPLPTSLSTRFLWVFPVHQARALVSCIEPGLVICFTLDNIHVSMLFSWNIPPSPSPTESKSLFCISVSLFLFCI